MREGLQLFVFIIKLLLSDVSVENPNAPHLG